jgi:hypothetical protein
MAAQIQQVIAQRTDVLLEIKTEIIERLQLDFTRGY